MGLIKMFKSFILMLAQILKKILILATVIAILAAGYYLWRNFIKDTQKHTKSAAVTRAQKQGLEVK
jgi:uncharacterized membrane protein